MNSLRKNEVEAQVESTLKIMERAGSPVIDVAVKKNSLLVYVLFWGNFAGSVWLCSGKGERLGYETSGFEVQVRPLVEIFFLFDRNSSTNRPKISQVSQK